MVQVNPEILKWARETAGLNLSDAVQMLGINDARGVAAIDRLTALEAGVDQPSRPMILKMVNKYHRPLLTFYLSAPPVREDRGEDFRTLPETVTEMDKALVDAAVRDIRTRQSLVRAALQDQDEDTALDFIGAARKADGVAAVVQKITEQLEFNLSIYRRQSSPADAFKYMRSQAEAAGIFVILVTDLGSHHTAIPVENFRGFALADDVAPFIAINGNDSRGALAFTLGHELAHLWLGQTGISGNHAVQTVEKFCNDIASEILVPAVEFADFDLTIGLDFEAVKKLITEFAQVRKVSSTMIAYKLLSFDKISSDLFNSLRSAYRQDFIQHRERERERARQKDSGPSYLTIRRYRAGTALVDLVGRMMHSGTLTTTKAGKVLGVSGKNVQGVLEANRPRQMA
ncbi:DNA-binding protein [hydrothermal vent metagenome]|uniref:DNA-binding protein n=1 Tax=hydrothermal vent metagenome TaxID=652676 RepID=A0A3B1AZE1_9ZZZZ